MSTPKKTTRPRGRPPKPAAEKLDRGVVYLHADEWAKIEKHGRDWMRAVIRRAKPPAK